MAARSPAAALVLTTSCHRDSNVPSNHSSHIGITRVIVAAIALAAIALALVRLLGHTATLDVEQMTTGDTPATVYRPAHAQPAPAVVIAHGFAGSRQLMQPFAITLARNGYVAATFDFRGHGRNPRPLTGDVTEVDGATQTLLDELERVADFARELPASDGRVAVLGHSMASDIVVRYAQAQEVAATVGVSTFARSLEPTSPRNLLVVVGGLEAGALKRAAREAVAMAPSAPTADGVTEGATYGSHADGTARRMVVADGVEHIGVLYSPEALAAARDWMNTTFGWDGSGFVANRGAWIALLFAGIVALGWPAASLLPRVAEPAAGGGAPWRRSWPAAVVPALATPLLLRLVQPDFLPVLVADYLAVHFAVYGILTAAMLAWLRRGDPASTTPRGSGSRLIAATLLVTVFGLGTVGVALDHFVMAFLPTPERATLLAAMLGGTALWATTDEWLTRGSHAARGAYPATKILLLASLGGAVALAPRELFFLIIIAPAMIAVFVIFGLFSRWAYTQTGHPLAAALANAVILAWALAVTFPLLSGS